MPTNGKFDARLLKIYTGATPIAITHQTNASLSCSADMIDVTTKDSGGDRELLPGTRSWTMSGEGGFAFDAPNGYSALFAAWKNGTVVTPVLQTAVTGDKKYSGSAYLSSLEMTSSGAGGDMVTFSYTLEGTGGLTEATI